MSNLVVGPFVQAPKGRVAMTMWHTENREWMPAAKPGADRSQAHRSGAAGLTGRRRQSGAVLVVALIFLLLITILAIGSSGRSLLQERMVGGLRNAQQAEWSAESALRGAEWKLFTGDASVACYNSSNPAAVSAKVTAFQTSPVWLTTGATAYAGAGVVLDYSSQTSNAVLANNPYYLIEYLGEDIAPDAGTSRAKESPSRSASTAKFYLYRITARATGGNANTIRVIQSTFVTPNLFACTLN